MKRKISLLICALMLLSSFLLSCGGGNGDGKETTAPETTAAPDGALAPIPQKLVPEFIAKNLVIYNANVNPVTVNIDERTTIDLIYQGWPTICKGDGDTLYAASSLRMGHVDPFGATAFYVSHDGGETWEGPRVINDTPVDDRDTGIVYLGDGKLLITYFTIGGDEFMPGAHYEDQMTHHGNPAQVSALRRIWSQMTPEELDNGYWMLFSDDYGETWSEPVKAPLTTPHGPVVVNDGSLLFCGNVDTSIVQIHRSTDGGRTWEYRTEIPLPTQEETGVNYGFDEANIVQLRDGKYVAAIRAEDYANPSVTLCTFLSYSDDGINFTKAEKAEGVLGAPPHLLELSNGALLMTYGYRGGDPNDERYGIRARVSYDGGQTWDEEILLSESFTPDLGYPSTVELDDGTLITAYYQPAEGDTVPNLLCTKWKLVEPTE